MNQYILDTDFAVKSLFALVTHELNQIKALKKNEAVFQERANHIHSESYYVTDQDADDLETPGMYMNRHGYGKFISAAQSIQAEIDKLEFSLSVKEQSIRSLCGAILQIAKQGLATVHTKKLITVPVIFDPKSGEPLHNIIWQARNQSAHYEEGSFLKGVNDCFGKLHQAYGPDFDLSVQENKAKYVLFDVLGWRSYQDYEKTMKQLLP